MDCIEAYEATSDTANIKNVIKNLSAAIVLEYNLLQNFNERFVVDSVRNVNSSSEIYSAIQKLTSLICIVHFSGMIVRLL